MTFTEVLANFRQTSFTERNKGTRFERLIAAWFNTDPRFSGKLEHVWMWEDFPARKDFGGKDIGIDLVAKTDIGDYWAIQCKCYDENAFIDKKGIDSFIAASGKTFLNEVTCATTRFAARYWVSTSNNWSSTADEEIQNMDIPFKRITLSDLQSSPVDWQKLFDGLEGKKALVEGKKPFAHQLDAISYAEQYFAEHDRGKMIMACGTGKTYTSELIVEQLLHDKGLVLFMVPSIALLGQTLNAWCADAKKPIKAVCICSDSKASRKVGKDDDFTLDSTVDLALPASTDAESIKKQLLKYRDYDGLVVVFSTYQSVDAVRDAQKSILKETKNEYGVFDFIICDEAHRTTGVKLSTDEESSFIKVHKDENVKGRKRLYMTATPRLYADSAKIKAKTNDKIDYLCSMDDESIYGEEFYRVSFSYAVEHELLTDYKVLVLTVNEKDLPAAVVQEIKDGSKTEVTTNYDDASRLVGVVNGLSKLLKDDEGTTWEADPCLMKRAVAFCPKIGREDVAGSSKNIAAVLPQISQHVIDEATPEQRTHIVSIEAKHVDGTNRAFMQSSLKNAATATTGKTGQRKSARLRRSSLNGFPF
jgi:predicted helicase